MVLVLMYGSRLGGSSAHAVAWILISVVAVGRHVVIALFIMHGAQSFSPKSNL